MLDELGLGEPLSLTPVGGGCIADARVAKFPDGTQVFVKSAAGRPDMFFCEAHGLEALAEAEAIRVPQVLAVSATALALECIAPGHRGADFFPEFGRQFAALHRSEGRTFGFHENNYIGSTPQENRPLDSDWEEAPADDGSSWPAFYLERRLRYQAELAERNGHGSELVTLLDRVETSLVERLEAAIETPRLLHGDLWGGNYMVDEGGSAVLIDPAAYFGHREADLAMTRLFGGFDQRFYDAYHEAFPLAPGHEERLPAYQLYHLLNHLNLFGTSYYAQCRRILQYYSR